MSRVLVRIPTPLRGFTAGKGEIEGHGETVGEVIQMAGAGFPGLMERVLKPDGQPREFVNLYLGSENISAMQGLETPVREGDVLSILPAVAGGGS